MKTEKEMPVIRTQVAGFSNTLSRLQVGMLVEFSGVRCRVSMVNDCRARLVPLSRTKVEVKTLGGAEIKFERPPEGINISPNAEIEIVGFAP